MFDLPCFKSTLRIRKNTYLRGKIQVKDSKNTIIPPHMLFKNILFLVFVYGSDNLSYFFDRYMRLSLPQTCNMQSSKTFYFSSALKGQCGRRKKKKF